MYTELEEIAKHPSHYLNRARFSLNLSYEEAEDAMQEALLLAYRHMHTFKGNSKLSTWFYRIFVNCVKVEKRKKRAKRRYGEHVSLDAKFTDRNGEEKTIASIIKDKRVDIEREVGARERLERVMKKVDSLCPAVRVAMVSIVEDDALNPKSRAQKLNITLPALKARVHRGHLALQKAGL